MRSAPLTLLRVFTPVGSSLCDSSRDFAGSVRARWRMQCPSLSRRLTASALRALSGSWCTAVLTPLAALKLVFCVNASMRGGGAISAGTSSRSWHTAWLHHQLRAAFCRKFCSGGTRAGAAPSVAPQKSQSPTGRCEEGSLPLKS